MESNSIFAVEVSVFANAYDQTPNAKLLLSDVLFGQQYREKVEALRSNSDPEVQKKKKKLLPRFCPLGVTDSSRNILAPSGFMAVDIDGKDNPIPNFLEAFPAYITDRRRCPKIAPYIAYCGLSSRGNGYVLLLRISDPARWKDHYRAAEYILQEYGIKADHLSSSQFLRFVSYDPAPFFNESAKVFTEKYAERHAISPAPRKVQHQHPQTTDEAFRVCLYQIEQRKIDITQNIRQWFALGCSIAAAFGEEGRGYFHAISRFYVKDGHHYTRKETDRTYTRAISCTKANDLGYFFQVCAENGILWLKD